MAYEDKPAAPERQRITLEGRARLAVSGVEEVLSFDEQRIIARTVLGELTIAGAELHVGKLSLDTGELTVTGRVDDLSFAGQEAAGGFWSRLFG